MSGARLQIDSKKPGLEVYLDENRSIKGWTMDNNGVFYSIKNGHVSSTIMLNLDAILAMNAIMRQLIDVKVPSYGFAFNTNTGSFFKNHKRISHSDVLEELNKGAQAIALNEIAKQSTISDPKVQQEALEN